MIHDTDQPRLPYLQASISMSQLVTKGPTYSHVVTEDPAHQCDRGFFSTNFMSNARWKCSNTEQVLQETSPSPSLWAESRVMTTTFASSPWNEWLREQLFCAYRPQLYIVYQVVTLVIILVVVVVMKMMIERWVCKCLCCHCISSRQRRSPVSCTTIWINEVCNEDELETSFKNRLLQEVRSCQWIPLWQDVNINSYADYSNLEQTSFIHMIWYTITKTIRAMR